MFAQTFQRGFVRILVLAVLAFMALAAWAVSSPAGSSPDDDFHLSSIWCGQGERDGLCESITAEEVSIPTQVFRSPCFAYNNSATGVCQENFDTTLGSTSRLNTIEHSYPTGFYWTMSWFASDNLTWSVLAMRLFNVALFIGLASATLLLIQPIWRRPLGVILAVTIVPLGMFVIASTNPSSWALFVPVFLFFSLRSLVVANRHWQHWSLAALSIGLAAIGTAARADAAFFVVAATGLALLAEWGKWWRFARVYLTSACIGLLAVISVLNGRQAGVISSGLEEASAAARTSVGLLLRNLGDVASLYTGALGGWNLGWLDTPLPSIVSISLTVIIGSMVLNGIAFKQLRELILPTITLAIVIVVPLIIQQNTGSPVGAYIQPRYVFPLLALGLGVLVSTKNPRMFITPRQVALASVTIVVLNAMSLYVNLLRYTTGLDTGHMNPSSGTWQPVVSPLIVLALGVIAFAALMWLGYRWLYRGCDEASASLYAFTPPTVLR